MRLMRVLMRHAREGSTGVVRRVCCGGTREIRSSGLRVLGYRLRRDGRETSVLRRVGRGGTAGVRIEDGFDVGRRSRESKFPVRPRSRIDTRVASLRCCHVGGCREQLAVERRKDVCERIGSRSERSRIQVDLPAGQSSAKPLTELEFVRALTLRCTRYSSTRSRLVPRKSTFERLRQNRMIVSSLLPERSTQGRIVMLRSRLIFSVRLTKSCESVRLAISVECGSRYSL